MSEYQAKSKDQDLPSDWVPLSDRNAKYETLRKEYMRWFETSPLMLTAKAGNYDMYLRQMAYSLASLQAAIIANLPNRPGVDTVTMGIAGVVDHKRLSKRLQEECEQQASSGRISISIPSELTEVWRKVASAGK